VVLLKRLLVVVAVVVLTAACASLPTDSSWGDLSLIGDPPQILFSFGDRIVRLDPANGQDPVQLVDANGTGRVDDQGNPRRWIVQTTSGTPHHFYTRPVATDATTLVTTTYEEKLFQVDVAAARILNPDGITLPGHMVANPLLTEKYLYVPLSDGALLALSLSDFSTAWKFDSDKNKGFWSQPLLADGTLYASSMDHNLYALDAETGTEKWRLDLEGAVASTPVLADGALYVGSYGHKVFKISTDGSILAQFSTNGWVWGAPAVVDGTVYVSDLDGYVYALKDSGSSLDEVWSRKVAGGAVRMTPLVTGDTIVVGSRDHNVYWISRETGEETFHREVRGEVLSDILLIEPNATIREPMIIVSTLAHEELLVAFTLEKGERRWVYTF
jgi:outer membrane protein assembly factor BamB